MLGLAFQRMNHRFTSALSLSIATLMKGPAVFLLIYFVVFRRDARYLTYFLVSTLALAGVSLPVVPLDLYWYYLVKVLPSMAIARTQGRFGVAGAQSILKFVSMAGLTWLTPIISIAGFMLFAVFSFWAGSRTLQSVGGRPIFDDSMFLMNVLVTLQLIPRTEVYSYVWIILPLALCLSGLLLERVNGWYVGVFGVATFLFNSVYGLRLYGPGSPPILIGPFEIMGNLILTLALAAIYLRPALAFKRSGSAG